mmetsp:Transcript_7006/g.22192  ORF Transcript_7006/g.22192 Transcript_7006/m.22192 type:complete len:207 (-) Transcript_7006:170-790(-)
MAAPGRPKDSGCGDGMPPPASMPGPAGESDAGAASLPVGPISPTSPISSPTSSSPGSGGASGRTTSDSERSRTWRGARTGSTPATSAKLTAHSRKVNSAQERTPRAVATSPPMAGPSTMPRPDHMLRRPMCAARSRWDVICATFARTKDCVCLKPPAMTRENATSSSDDARPSIRYATVAPMMQTIRVRLRPATSPTWPAMGELTS